MNSSELLFGPINQKTQGLSVLGSLILLYIIYFLVRKGHIKSGYSILWFFVAGFIFILSSFIDILYWFSSFTGIYYPTSFIFSVLIVGIILILIHFSVVLTRQEKRIRILTQKYTLLKN